MRARVVRSWSGVAAVGKHVDYVTHLERDVVPSLQRLQGFCGMRVLRQMVDGRHHFRVLTLWESLDSIRAFAGDAIERAVVPEAARAALSSFDRRVEHFDIVMCAEPIRGESQRELLDWASNAACDYLGAIDLSPIFPSQSALDGLRAFEEAVPEASEDPLAVLNLLDTVGSPATVACTGGRYFGFVVGGALPVTVAASWLATAWDQNAAFEVLSPVVTRLERVCEGWLIDLLGLPSGSAVGFVSGTSEANIAALAAARNHILKRAGWSVATQGLRGSPALRVVVGKEAHAAVGSALRIVGIGEEACERVATDDQGRMDPEALPRLDDRTIVILQAGHVDSGAFDPLRVVCERAREAGAWVHVEGAFGLWAACSPRHRDLVDGHDRADSWAVDAHKYLNVPYDSGFVICRDRAALLSAFRADAPYLHLSPSRDGSALTPTMSRRARVVEVWAAIKSLGRSGVADLVDRTCLLARHIAAGLRAAGFDVLNDVVLNQVLIGTDSNERTARVARYLQSEGTCWCSTTAWRGRTAIRISVISWATSREDADRTIQAFVAAASATRCGPHHEG